MPRTMPMFPLGAVLMPHMVLPLHIFEPRYRAMIARVLDDDREFGVVLITRGHEIGGGDLRSEHGTVARVVQAEETDDGRWLAISVGTRRIRVVRWLEDDPYPCAEVEDVEEAPAEVTPETDELVAELTARLRRVLAMHLELGFDGVPPTVELDEDDPEVAAWQIAVFAPLTPFDAQAVLRAETTEDRLVLLRQLLGDLEEVLGFQMAEDGPGSPGDDGGHDPGDEPPT